MCGIFAVVRCKLWQTGPQNLEINLPWKTVVDKLGQIFTLPVHYKHPTLLQHLIGFFWSQGLWLLKNVTKIHIQNFQPWRLQKKKQPTKNEGKTYIFWQVKMTMFSNASVSKLFTKNRTKHKSSSSFVIHQINNFLSTFPKCQKGSKFSTSNLTNCAMPANWPRLPKISKIPQLNLSTF